MTDFGDLSKPENLSKLDNFLADNSFLTEKSLIPGPADFDMFKKLANQPLLALQKHPNLFRWSKQVLSTSMAAGDSCCGAPAPAPTGKVDVHNRPKNAVKAEKPKLPAPGKILDPPPAYLAERVKIWDELREKHHQFIAKQQETSVEIEVKLPDGKIVPNCKSWVTTPMDIALGISKGLAKSCIIAKLNGTTLWDMTRPLEESCTIQLLKFDNKEAQEVFWHSSAHVIGEAMEQYLGGSLVFGPPLEEGGFYYDIDSEYTISENDFKKIEDVVGKITKEDQPFERLIVSKTDLLRMFDYNPYKQKVLNEKVQTEYTSAYRCGTLIDLCRGPHLSKTGQIKAFKCLKTSSAYFEGKADQESLSRLYGISFPDKKLLKTWEKNQEEAKKRDHRRIGKDQELFFFDPHSPGCCFWYPKGAFIFNQLQNLMREEYRKRGFKEVITPNMFDSELWKTSGHWEHYSDDMFKLTEVEKKVFGLKPMNCPSHCLMFRSKARSFRELPLLESLGLNIKLI